MAYRRILTALLVLFSIGTPFFSYAPPKEAEVDAKPISITGVLEKDLEGRYSITVGSTRNRITYFLECDKKNKKPFKNLKKLVGKEINAEGEIKEETSPWNYKILLTAVQIK